jgi:G:T/U-mismatch repair DNA glycosylase
MAYSYEDIIKSQYEAKAAERAQALADLEAARINENAADTMYAADRIVDIDKSLSAIDRIANQYTRQQQQQPQGNKFGLTPAEVEVAHNSFSGASIEERERSYRENRDKLRRMRADGTYRDDQGRASR